MMSIAVILEENDELKGYMSWIEFLTLVPPGSDWNESRYKGRGRFAEDRKSKLERRCELVQRIAREGIGAVDDS